MLGSDQTNATAHCPTRTSGGVALTGCQRLILLVFLGPALLAGCATLPADAVQRIEKARSHYQSTRYDEAQRLVNTVIAEYPKTKGVGAAYYFRGMCHYRQGRPGPASSDLMKALGTAAGSKLVAQANAQLGHIWYQRKEYGKASTYYAQAIKAEPEMPFMNQVYYRCGESLQKTGQWDAARKILPKVWKLFAGSDLAGYAKRKFSWPHDYFSIQCGAFDRSDLAHGFANELRRKGFVAATEVNVRGTRAKHVVYVGRYSRFPDAEAALVQVRLGVADAYIVP